MTRTVLALSCVALVIAHGSARAEGDAPALGRAVRRAGKIVIDGSLRERAWAAAPAQGNFVQRLPHDGARATCKTRFAVAYDDDALFVAVWADDPEAGADISAPLTRRDVDSPGDAVAVEIDSYHDRRTAYVFQLNAAGVQRDVLLFDDARADDTWDAVWTGNVARTSAGWTAEFRIPLSQLRFPQATVQEWGFQVVRTIGRTGEVDVWSPWPPSAPEVVSKFGVIEGIAGVGSNARFELLPYVSAIVSRSQGAPGDPFNGAWRQGGNAGAALKYGLGPAFTLSATFNPDFGQVEADPSKINLSANELLLTEKRAFFLEAADLFKLAIGDAGEGAFYSRRIGAAPPAPEAPYDYLRAPDTTAIIGAAKLTGKTAGGWSVGVLDAVTDRETAEIASAAASGPPVGSEVAVAPLTNYAVARIKRDLRGGATSIGASATAVNRQFDDRPLADIFHDQAYSGGAQLQHRWDDNAWTSELQLLGSWVHGTAAAIARTQRGAVHLFQRPDAGGGQFEPRRTSLAGLGAGWQLSGLGDTEHWKFGLGGDLRTRGLELNDAGFQLTSDQLTSFAVLRYHDDAPSEDLLSWMISGNVFLASTLEPRVTEYGAGASVNVRRANYWTVTGNVVFDRGLWSIGELRGGPALRTDPGVFGGIAISTDVRNPTRLDLAVSAAQLPTHEQNAGLEAGLAIQARSNIDLFLGGSLSVRDHPMQYVAQAPDESVTGITHYVLGRILETDASLTLRANWMFSPQLSLQVYAQPYLAAGLYADFKDVDHAGAERYTDRFRAIAGDEIQLMNGAYRVSAAGQQFRFDRPDFNFRQLRATVLVRWDYRPGSSIFAIWNHGRTDAQLRDGALYLARDISDLAGSSGASLFMLKASYWFGQ